MGSRVRAAGLWGAQVNEDQVRGARVRGALVRAAPLMGGGGKSKNSDQRCLAQGSSGQKYAQRELGSWELRSGLRVMGTTVRTSGVGSGQESSGQRRFVKGSSGHWSSGQKRSGQGNSGLESSSQSS